MSSFVPDDLPELIMQNLGAKKEALQTISDGLNEIASEGISFVNDRRVHLKTDYEFMLKEKLPTVKEIFDLFQTRMQDKYKAEKELMDIYQGQVNSVLNSYLKKCELMEKEQSEKMKSRRPVSLPKYIELEATLRSDLSYALEFAVFEEINYHMQCANILSKLFKDINNKEVIGDLQLFIENQGFNGNIKGLDIDFDEIKKKKKEQDLSKNVFEDEKEMDLNKEKISLASDTASKISKNTKNTKHSKANSKAVSKKSKTNANTQYPAANQNPNTQLPPMYQNPNTQYPPPNDNPNAPFYEGQPEGYEY